MDYSTDITESVSSLNVNGPAAYVYSVNVSAAFPVLLIAQAEVTNDTKNNIGVGRYILRSDGKKITSPVLDNVTPQMHHMVVNLSAFDFQPITNANYYLVLYALGPNGAEKIRVEGGYGFLQAAEIQ